MDHQRLSSFETGDLPGSPTVESFVEPFEALVLGLFDILSKVIPNANMNLNVREGSSFESV